MKLKMSWIKWNNNRWRSWNIRDSCTKLKSVAVNPSFALRVYVNMSDMHEIGAVW